jgi:hypothetical protein
MTRCAWRPIVFSTLIGVLAAGCGGGGGNGGTAVPAAPTLTLAASSIVTGSSTIITWSSAGATSCTASGSWSGTLAASGSQTITPAAEGTYTYELSCADSAGSSKTSSVTLTALHAMSYSSLNYQFTTGIAAQTVTSPNSALTNWWVSPPLPAGLVLYDGKISGTPTVATPTAQYLVTAYTGPGSAGEKFGAELTVGVSSNVLLNLGHINPIPFVQFDTSHVLSQDSTGFWILWNYATKAQIATGVAQLSGFPAPMALAGPMLVIQTGTGLELRASATGNVLAEVTLQLEWWKVASDGSYVCGGNASQLVCWSPTGQQLISEAGNYYNANVFAAPSELLIALGAAGNGVIETVSSATWTSSTGPAFQGTFDAWFVDGSQFLTTDATSSTVYEYSLASVLEGSASLPTLQGLAGQGNWIWTNQPTIGTDPFGNPEVLSNAVTIYPVGNSATPAATLQLGPVLMADGTFIDALSGSSLTVVDLSGATPAQTSYTLPIAVPPPQGATVGPTPFLFGAISPTQFMESTQSGILVDGSVPGAPRNFGYGAIVSIAGSTARAVFTTESGSTFSYNSATNAFETTPALAANQQVALSADGSVLAALDTSGNVNVYSLPGWTLINALPASGAVAAPTSIVLSASGTILGEQLPNGSTQSVPVAGGVATAYPGPGPIQLSPDGTLAAVASESISAMNASIQWVYINPTTAIYQNGTLQTTLAGYPVGWLDDSRLLVNSYSAECGFIDNAWVFYMGATIYGPTGTKLAAPPIGGSCGQQGTSGEIDSLQVVSSDLVYSQQGNAVTSLTSGANAWVSQDPFSGQWGVFAGSAIVFVSGNLVLAQPY